jgi:hypothetical protein
MDAGSIALTVLEDPLAIVGVAGFDSWTELAAGWSIAQDRIVSAIGGRIASGEPKAWDGYLALLTPQQLTEGEQGEAARIRYDTRRLRKIVITGDEAPNLGRLPSALLPVRPILEEGDLERFDPLARLRDHLIRAGAEAGAVDALLEAYTEGRLLMDAIHAWRAS